LSTAQKNITDKEKQISDINAQSQKELGDKAKQIEEINKSFSCNTARCRQ